MAEGKNHRVAGILNIISGAFALLGFLMLLVGIVAVSYTHLTLPTTPYV